jgi:SPP1 family predicted phage head-tail adaptor
MLNDRITLQTRQAGVDEVGQPVETWADAAQVWANVRFQTGAEVLRNDLAASIVRISVRIRVLAGIDASWRLVFKDAAYNVKSALPDSEDRRFMFLVCESAS